MAQFRDCTPIITVSDLAKAKGLFVDTLGFGVDFETGPPGFVTGVVKDSVQVMLIGADGVNARQRPGTANVSFLTDEVDELFEACRTAGIEVIVAPADRDYGQRDFAIRDPDGNVMVFGCPL